MPPTDAPRLAGQVAPEAATAAITLLCTAAFMTMLDLFIVNVAFASIGRTFAGSSLAGLSWVLNAYIVVYAACLIPAGSLSDRYGRKRGFLAGLALFTIAGLGCAVAPTLSALIGFRVLQAVGAAVLTPTSLGLMLDVLPVRRRAGAVRIWATTSSFAAAFGPIVGGLLAEASWRWAFLLNLPIGVLALVVAARLLPASAPSARTRIPDPVGAVAIAVAVGALSFGLVRAEEWGWGSGRMLLTAVVAALALALLGYRACTHPAPVLPPKLFRAPGFGVANLTILLFTAAFSAVFLSVALWLETAAGYGPLRAGVALLPGPLAVPLFAALTRRWAAGVPPGYVVSAGLVVFGLGSLLLVLGGGVEYGTGILPGWIVIGAGIGIAMPTVIGVAIAALPPEDTATGSAVVNTARQAGYALGIAALVTILGSLHASDGFRQGWILVTALVLAGAVTALGIDRRVAAR
ncbi:MFS transporter [Nocardia sp. NPDC050697]|uniref:MFS transporter n=1 Tax=Nocardia sp. NPDC050697 TaxID=3155158 RepID=UPI003402F2E5